MDKDVAPPREGGATITVWTLDDKPDIQINIALERQNLFRYPNSFSEIQELQRALSSVPKEIKQQHRLTPFWDGPSYQVSVSDRTSDETTRHIVRLLRSETLHFRNRCSGVNCEGGPENLTAILSRVALN